MASTYELIVKTVDQSSRSLKNVENSLKSLESRSKATSNALKTVGAAAIAFATGSVARGIISQYTEFEKYRTVLTTFLGSSQKANAELARLQVLANSLPQDLSDVTQAFTILSRNGIDTSSASLTAFSNIATANAKSFSQLGEAVADALTGEFERLKEFGIKVSKENGKFVARIGDQQVAVAQSTTELVGQLRKLGEEGGKFGGAAAANAGTLSQSFSNLNGAVFATSVTIGEQLKPALKDVADLTAQWLNSHQELIAALSSDVGSGLAVAFNAIGTALSVIANNFKLIANAALTLIFTRIAASAATLITRFSSMISRLKDSSKLVDVFKNAVSRTFPALASLATRLSSLGPLLLNPWVAIPAAIIAAVTAGLYFFRDAVLNIGGINTTVGEAVAAVWWKIKEVISAVANVIGNAFSSAINQVSSWFSSLGIDVTGIFSGLGKIFYDSANYLIGVFVLAIKSIAAVFQELPGLILEIFIAIGKTAYDFGAALVNTFGNIGEGMYLAILAPFSSDTTFEDAINKITENAFAGLRDSATNNFKDVGATISNALQSGVDTLNYDYIGQGLTLVGDAVAGVVVEYRAFNDVQAATTASMLYYEDAIIRQANAMEIAKQAAAALAEQSKGLGSLRGAFSDMGALKAAEDFKALIAEVNIGIIKQEQNTAVVRQVNAAYRDGSINIEQYKAAMASLGTTIANTGAQLTGFQQYLRTTIDAASADVTQTGYAMQAKEALRGELDSGKISLDTYASAISSVNGQLGITTTAATATAAAATATAETIATVASTYQDATKAIAEFGLNQKNVSGAMGMLESDFAGGKISLEQFQIGMDSMGASMDNIQDRSIAMGLTITDAFEKAGNSLANGLAKGIIRGEGIMDSFKNFMSSILEQILTQIIQQAFIGPMISSMTSGLGQAFSLFAGGGFGGGKGGGGGFLSTLFGVGKMFLGLPFADGGIVPGLPTTGDSVPIMATPGEVILNKSQQAAVMNNQSSGEPITVNFNISAIDSRSGTQFILDNKSQITSVIQQAYNQRGRGGPLG